jgi:hypothetical protein
MVVLIAGDYNQIITALPEDQTHKKLNIDC